MNDFRDVIDLWMAPRLLASDIGEKPNLVHQWRKRNSIPSDKWKAVIEAGQKRGYPVDATMLTDLASRRPDVSA